MCVACTFFFDIARFFVSLPLLIVFATIILLSATLNCVLQILISISRAISRMKSNNKAHTHQMSPIRCFGFFLVIICFSYSSCAPIVKNVPVCRETNKSVDLDLPCHDTACVLYKNILY